MLLPIGSQNGLFTMPSKVQNAALRRHHILLLIDIPCIKNKYCIQRYLELLENKNNRK